MAFTEFLADCTTVFGVTGISDSGLFIVIILFSLTDRVTLDALLDRTLSLSASTVLCYQAANYSFIMCPLGFLEVFMCRTVLWQHFWVEVARGQHQPGVGGKSSELSSRNGQGWVVGELLRTHHVLR